MNDRFFRNQEVIARGGGSPQARHRGCPICEENEGEMFKCRCCGLKKDTNYCCENDVSICLDCCEDNCGDNRQKEKK